MTGGNLRRRFTSKGLVTGSATNAAPGWHIPALELERSVCLVAQQMLADRAALTAATEAAGMGVEHLSPIFETAAHWSNTLGSPTNGSAALGQLCERVVLNSDRIDLTLKLPLPTKMGLPATQTTALALTHTEPLSIRRRGIEMRLIIDNNASAPVRTDPPLLKALGRAYRWCDDLCADRVPSVAAIAHRERLDVRYVRRVLQLRFLAPTIVEAIVAGRHPAELSTIALTRRLDLPPLWTEQHRLLGIG